MDRKDRYDDLASLFLPDILHQAPSPIEPQSQPQNNPPQSQSQSQAQAQRHLPGSSPANTKDASGMSPNNLKFLSHMSLHSQPFPFLSHNDMISKGEGLFVDNSGVSASRTRHNQSTNNNTNNANSHANQDESTNGESSNPNHPNSTGETNNNEDALEDGLDIDQLEPQHLHYSLGHYSSFVPLEASLMPHHHHNHVMPSQLFPSSNTQPLSISKGIDPSWFNGANMTPNFGLEDNKFSADSSKMSYNMNQPSLNYTDLLDQNAFLLQQLQQLLQLQFGNNIALQHMLSQQQLQLPLFQQQQQQQQQQAYGFPGTQPSGSTFGSVPGSTGQLFEAGMNMTPSTDSNGKEKTPNADLKKRKRNYRKSNKRDLNTKFLIDYSPDKLTHLLNFKTRKLNKDYKLIDKNGEEIYLDFKGFLNGRFLTNDFDNSSYIHGVLDKGKEGIETFDSDELENGLSETNKTSGDPSSSTGDDTKKSDKNVDESAEPKRKFIKSDPKIISCYRRNYTQVSMNFNLSGFKSYSDNEPKILKLQTSEYGYNITRVVKWFKIEVTACSNNSKEESVPLIISDDIKEKDKKETRDEMNDDYVNPTPITSNEHIITLNNAQVVNDEIDNFFTVKKLRFQSATSNNGNFGFQNYYFLKVKLSAIVADLYYDDYIDEDFSVANPDNSRNEINLFELISEPIIVRGRNPSFYADRNDLLVRGKPVNNRMSYKHDGKVDMVRNDIKELNNEQEIKQELEREQQQQQNNHKRKSGKDSDNEGSELETSNETDGPGGDIKRHKSPTPLQIAAMAQNNLSAGKSISPLIYNANSSSINLEKILKNQDKQLLLNTNSDETYTYFPISNVYYLPPINVVYFPHAAHQNVKPQKTTSPSVEDVSVSRRKSSNVYFK